jgi:hypothetical protein
VLFILAAMTQPVSFDQLLLQLPVATAQLAQATRSFVVEQLPDVQETIDLPARLAAYGYGTGYKHNVCVLLVSKSGIKLGFYKGSTLPQPRWFAYRQRQSAPPCGD